MSGKPLKIVVSSNFPASGLPVMHNALNRLYLSTLKTQNGSTRKCGYLAEETGLGSARLTLK